MKRHYSIFAPGLSDANTLDPVESFFHRVFGSRGVSETELSTERPRQRLQEVYDRLTIKIGKMSSDRAADAVSLLGRIQRHLQTYPETNTEKGVWITMAASLIKEAKKYLGPGVEIFVGAVVLGLGAFAAYRVWRNRR